MVRHSPQGLHPCTRVPFLCFAKEKEPKERRPRCLRPWLRQGCPAVLEERAQAQNSLRSLRSLRSDSCAKFEHEARCARGPALLCSSAWHRGGPEQPAAKQPRPNSQDFSHRAVSWLLGCCPYALPRSAARLGSARQRAIPINLGPTV